MTVPLIRIDTNQGISGYGEVRDGSSETYALFLKSRILGENPCNVDKIFRKIKQFGAPARQAGGVCGIEMACMDLAGKAWGVPCWQMLGGKFRDRVRLYADTTHGDDPKEQARKAQGADGPRHHVSEAGLRHRAARGQARDAQPCPPATRIRGEAVACSIRSRASRSQTRASSSCPTGWDRFARSSAWRFLSSSDHYGHFGVNSGIKLARAMEKWNLAWMEDIVPWQYGELLKQIKDSTTTPVLTGEDIYLKEDFIKLIDMGAVDMIHPDLASSGGLIETKKIGDYAMEHGVAMAMHFAGSPVSYMANVHCAAATENFIALEHHSLDVPWWESLVTTTGGKPLVEKGFAPVPDSPGLGVELNEEASGAPAPGIGLFRADPAVGQAAQQRSAVELRSIAQQLGGGASIHRFRDRSAR